MINFAGAEPDEEAGVGDGFDAIPAYPPGPSCRWNPTAESLPNGSIVSIGGSNVGPFVLNEAKIHVPTYELIKVNGAPPAPVTLPVLEFTEAENNQPNKSYNLSSTSLSSKRCGVFTLAGRKAIIWDYELVKLVEQLTDVPLEPRYFPPSATSVLLPLEGPNFDATVLLCGESSGDIPNPQALNDWYAIQPNSDKPVWQADDNLLNGPQTISDGILLPDGTVLSINGAHTGSAGGFMADDPGSRFTSMPSTQIPRLCHSVASLLPSGEVIVAGSNPMVFYTSDGGVLNSWAKFWNYQKEAFLNQQQKQTSQYPTEYRVEIFSPPYMDATERPKIVNAPDFLAYGKEFKVKHTMKGAPPGSSIAQPGVYLLFVVVDGISSEGKRVKLA
ncbi:hypothetical protein EKO04_010180 [Ascochyta lentis]|uniref:Galactose oxidase-like Early set domain-containing protein n=1 Tax=Ascochyta lentis TaxID=205686 RepID=A0A8H7IWG9_9PLEO|nr:hypothetical protein EKO04_010180 [Ascochyta lentis]